MTSGGLDNGGFPHLFSLQRFSVHPFIQLLLWKSCNKAPFPVRGPLFHLAPPPPALVRGPLLRLAAPLVWSGPPHRSV